MAHIHRKNFNSDLLKTEKREETRQIFCGFGAHRVALQFLSRRVTSMWSKIVRKAVAKKGRRKNAGARAHKGKSGKIGWQQRIHFPNR